MLKYTDELNFLFNSSDLKLNKNLIIKSRVKNIVVDITRADFVQICRMLFFNLVNTDKMEFYFKKNYQTLDKQ